MNEQRLSREMQLTLQKKLGLKYTPKVLKIFKFWQKIGFIKGKICDKNYEPRWYPLLYSVNPNIPEIIRKNMPSYTRHFVYNVFNWFKVLVRTPLFLYRIFILNVAHYHAFIRCPKYIPEIYLATWNSSYILYGRKLADYVYKQRSSVTASELYDE